MNSPTGKSVFPSVATVVVFLVALCGMTTPAFAGPDLLDELTTTHDTVVAADIDKMQDSPLYEQGFDILGDHPRAGDLFERLERDFDIDPRRDLDSLVITSDAPPLSTEMFEQPARAIQSAAEPGDDRALILVRGDLDAPGIITSVADDSADLEKQEENPTYTRSQGVEWRVLDDRTIAIAAGPSDYLDDIRASYKKEVSGPDASFRTGIQKLGSAQGLYMMIVPTIEDEAEFRRQVGATASFAGLVADLGTQHLQLGVVATLEDEESATETIEEIDAMRQRAGNHPMVDLIGVRPLLDNMSIQQNDRDVVVRTSASNREARRLVGQLESILETEQQLQEPLDGDGFDPEADDEDDPSGTEDDDSGDDGLDADFN